MSCRDSHFQSNKKKTEHKKKKADLPTPSTQNMQNQIKNCWQIFIFLLHLPSRRFYSNAKKVPIKNRPISYPTNVTKKKKKKEEKSLKNLFFLQSLSQTLSLSLTHIIRDQTTHIVNDVQKRKRELERERGRNERQIDCRYGDVQSWRTWSVSLSLSSFSSETVDRHGSLHVLPSHPYATKKKKKVLLLPLVHLLLNLSSARHSQKLSGF